jgi:hypothetical protein
MKNKTILFAYIFLMIPSFFYSSNSIKKMFSGSIEFPCDAHFQDLCFFYKGEKLKIENHGSIPLIEYSFFDDSQIHCIYVIITKQLTHCTQVANTLETLKVCPSSDYICYKLEAKRNLNPLDETSILSWEIFDHKLTNNNIPLNSFIFLFDPKYIAGLKVQSWKAENAFRIIPTIVIHPFTLPSEINQAIIQGQLAALDINPVHATTDSYALPPHINNKRNT